MCVGDLNVGIKMVANRGAEGGRSLDLRRA